MTTARRLVLILVGAGLLIIFIGRFVLIELLVRRVGLQLILAMVEGAAIIGVGYLASRCFAALTRSAKGHSWGRDRANIATAFILGYPLFGALCFLLGTILISAATMAVPLIVGIAALIVTLLWRAPQPTPGSADPLPRVDGRYTAETASIIAIAAIIACGFVVAQAPPVSLDELAYHLAVPHMWALEGRAVELPLLSHSYFPLGIESADLPLFAILGRSGGIASHFLHLMAAIAVVAILWNYARRKSVRSGALIAAAIVATPALAVTTGWSLVEWPLLGIFVVAAIAVEEADDATLAAAIAAGLLTKYTFVPFAVLLIAASRRWRPAVFGTIGGSIFFIRNLVLTGNPIAPFFSAHTPHVSGFRAADVGAYLFDGRFVDESLGASMLMLVPAAAGVLAWICIALAVVLFLLASSSRLMLPYLATGALSALKHDGNPSAEMTLQRRIMHGLLVTGIAAQLLLVVWFTGRDDAFSLIAGRVSDEEYVAARRASYPAVAWLNSVLPVRSRTLIVGLNETYWFEHPVRGGGNFDGRRLSAYLAEVDLRNRLKRDGITHVALFAQAPPTAEAQKRAERETALSAEAQRALGEVLRSSAAGAVGPDGVQLFVLR